MSYKSMFEIIRKEMEMQVENEVYKAVQKYDIHVDKEELIKALKYDRGQYEKGYWDAKEELFDRINTLERDKIALEKALDKACERLETYDMLITDCDNKYYWKAEKWKEDLMSDES